MESTGLARFLFELASDERLGILGAIEEKPLRHAQIARRLKITDSETTRHLNRRFNGSADEKSAEPVRAHKHGPTCVRGLPVLPIPARESWVPPETRSAG